MVKIPLKIYCNAKKLPLYSYDFGGRQPDKDPVQMLKRRADVLTFELNSRVAIL